MNPERASCTAVRRLFILLCGFEILPKTVSTRGLGGRFILSEPVCAYLLDTENGWVLLDAGLNPANGRDPVRIEQRFRSQGFTPPVIRDGHLLEKQFADIGVTFADVRHVILSHLHYDHCGYLEHFAHARISIQRREFEHAFGENPGVAYFRTFIGGDANEHEAAQLSIQPSPFETASVREAESGSFNRPDLHRDLPAFEGRVPC